MSNRLCTSLLHLPRRSQTSLPRCGVHNNFPILRDDLHHPRNTPSKRQFTSSSPCSSGVSALRGIQGRKQSQPSMAVQIKEQQKMAERDGSRLEHMGFLPGSYVPPTGKNLPSWFSNPKDRWKVLKMKGWNWWYYATSHVQAYWMVKPRVKLERGKLPNVSKKLYEEMYAHFATGNLQAIEGIVSLGMLGSLRSRIALRTPNSGLQWTLHKYLSTPKVVSYRFQVLPKGPNTDKFGFSQAVVRIRSLQSLTRTKRTRMIDRETNTGMIMEVVVDSQGNIVPDASVADHRRQHAKETTEYLVVQRFVRHSRPGEWHIWGTAEETTLDKLKAEEKDEEREMMSRV